MTTNQRNGARQLPGSIRNMSSRAEYEPGNEFNGLYEAIQSFREVDGDIYKLLRNSNLPEGKHQSVGSLYARGMKRMKRDGKDVKEILNNQDRWHELPNPLIQAITFVLSSSADIGTTAMQSVMAMTGTMVVPKTWQGKEVKEIPRESPSGDIRS